LHSFAFICNYPNRLKTKTWKKIRVSWLILIESLKLKTNKFLSVLAKWPMAYDLLQLDKINADNEFRNEKLLHYSNLLIGGILWY